MSRSVRLGLALAASVAFHLALLGVMAARPRVSPPPRPALDTALIAIESTPPEPLAEPPASPPGVTSPSPLRPARPRVPNRPRARTPARALAPRVLPSAPPRPDLTPSQPPPAPSVPSASPASASIPDPRSPIAAGGASARAPSLAGEASASAPIPGPRSPIAAGGASASAPFPIPHSPFPARSALAQIQSILAARARGCYPAPAARLGLAGTAQIRFCVRGGVGTDVTVAHSSGEPMLDRAAADCVVSGAPLPALERCAVVPVRFKGR